MFSRPSVVLMLTLLLGTPGMSHAQQPLAGLLIDLLSEGTVNRTAPSGQPGGVHEPHFLVGETQKIAPFELNNNLAWQLASFPVASSSAGFTYSVNPSTGQVVPTSTSFGPSFAERGLTNGRGKFNIGFSFQSVGYDSFAGADLEDDGLTFMLEHSNCCPAGGNAPTNLTDFSPDLERDLLETNLQLDVTRRTTAIVANYGVTDRFDIGVAIPFVNVEMNAVANVRVVRTATGANPLIHSFDGLGLDRISLARSGSASGLGDVMLRAKVNLMRTASSALAATGDLFLPTGDEDNLLGTGATQFRALFIASGEYGRLSPHANVGFTVASGESSSAVVTPELESGTHRLDTIPQFSFSHPAIDLSVPNQFNYNFGASVVAAPRLTLGFDVTGRTIFDVAQFDVERVTYANRAAGPLPTAPFVQDAELQVTGTGRLNLVLGVASAKINLARTLLLNASVLFPLSDSGLRPKPTPVIGLDYVF